MNPITPEKNNPENLGINLDGRLDAREKKDFSQYIRENKDQLGIVGLQALEKAKVWEIITSTDAEAMNNEQLLMVQMLWNILLDKGVVSGTKVSVDSYIGPQTRNIIKTLKVYRSKVNASITVATQIHNKELQTKSVITPEKKSLTNNLVSPKPTSKEQGMSIFTTPLDKTLFNMTKEKPVLDKTQNTVKKIDQINFKEEYKNLINLDNISLPVNFAIGNISINKIIQFGQYINQQQFQGLSVDGRAKACMKFLISEGLPLNIAAGVVGNLHHESMGFNTTAIGDNKKAFGLAQRHPNRQWGIGNYLVDNKLVKNQLPSLFDKSESEFKKLPNNTRIEYLNQNFADYRMQLLGILFELAKKGNGGHQLTTIKSPASAATVFCNNFERPNKKLANVSGRVSYANKAYKMFAGNSLQDFLAKA